MKQKIVFLITILNFFIAFGQSKKTENLDLLMKSANKIGIFNGNVIVSEKGRIIYQTELGFTDYTKSKILNRESQMPIGSIIKEFNSVGILLLVEKGKLNLERKVSDYLTGLPNWANKIQIKHLLQYTSGLPRVSNLAELNKVEKLEFEPGTGYIYSNGNVVLQQEIIKKITNISYEDFLKKMFFKKHKITGGKMPKDSILTVNMAGSFDNDFKETTFIHGGGEMYFSVGDLYNWVKDLHNKKIINKNSLNILAKSFDKNSESSLGNTTIENNEIIEHSHQGSGNNYESYIYHKLENNITIVLVTNSQNFKLGAITESIINILEDKPFTAPKKSIYLDIRGKLLDNFKNGISFYEQIKSTQKEKYDFSNEIADLINTGKFLMRRNRFEDAIKIFQLSTTVDLKNVNGISIAYSFIGECYQKTKNTDLAILNLKKALELDANNKNAEEMLKRIEIK
jgi:CubicO group peptidase (beta-lactamase class C family)